LIKATLTYTFFIVTNFLLGQSSIDYRFVVSNKIYLDSSKKEYVGKEFEYTQKRILLKNNSFVEAGMLRNPNDQYTSDTFKVEKNIWYVKDFEKWVKFVDKKNLKIGSFHINDRKYKTFISNEKTMNGHLVYELRFLPVGFVSSHEEVCLFSFNFGIIGFRCDGFWLIREDILR